MTQQSAVEWLIEKILVENEQYINDDGDYIQIPKTVFYNAFKDYVDLSDYVNEAKQMEKEQILNAFQESRLTHPMIGFKHKTFLEYYNETYGQGSPDTSPTK